MDVIVQQRRGNQKQSKYEKKVEMISRAMKNFQTPTEDILDQCIFLALFLRSVSKYFDDELSRHETFRCHANNVFPLSIHIINPCEYG